jgi:hypothetical protein
MNASSRDLHKFLGVCCPLVFTINTKTLAILILRVRADGDASRRLSSWSVTAWGGTCSSLDGGRTGDEYGANQ